MKVASRLRAAGMANAFDLSPKQLAFEARRRIEETKEDLFLNAIAAAVGIGGDKKALEAITP